MNAGKDGKAYHHGQLRQALIAAGLELLNEGGAAGVDLRKVARLAGVSHTAPYRHFPDKRALIAAIAEEGFVALSAALRAALAGLAAADGRSHFRAIGHAYVTFALAHPALMREMFSGLTVNRADYPTLYAASKESFGILWGVVAQTFGEPVELRTVVAFSAMHGLALLLLENQLPLTAEKTAADMIDATLETLMAGFSTPAAGAVAPHALNSDIQRV